MNQVANKNRKSEETNVPGLKRKEYEQKLRELHVELVKLQEWVKREGKKICVVFEGRDGAGKGGVIKAMTERVSPRVFRVVAMAAPTEREKSQMYIQRYLPHLPSGGEIVIFDRSWYNRAGVERVMGFCTEDHAKRFLNMVPPVEKAMVDSGVVLLKRDGMITREHVTTCSRRPTPRGRHGLSLDPTTRGRRDSTSLRTCSQVFPTRKCPGGVSSCRNATLLAASRFAIL
jgi:polyphosphate kinase 2 (PPK2 family)